MNYKHTQIGYLILFILILISLFFLWILTKSNFDLLTSIIMILVLIILSSFLTLNVIVNSKFLKIKFGPGIFRKNILINEIKSVEIVKNHWYYGWGIRYWYFPKMWIYNVSGFKAIEIKMKNGKINRIGTDEPEKLEKAIKEFIN